MKFTLLFVLLAVTATAKPHFQACASEGPKYGCFPTTSKHDALVQAHTMAEEMDSPYDQVWVQDTSKKAAEAKPQAPPVSPSRLRNEPSSADQPQI